MDQNKAYLIDLAIGCVMASDMDRKIKERIIQALEEAKKPACTCQDLGKLAWSEEDDE